MAATSPLVPLSPAAFRLALMKGQGRALQHIDQHGVTGIEAHLTQACTTCVAYDPQCEGMREEWLFALVERAQLQDSVLRAIVEAERHQSSHECHWDMQQRSAILRLMAASGSHEARQTLYATLAVSSEYSQLRSATDIIELDGIDGLLKVARVAGQQLREDPEFWVDDEFLRCCGEPLEAARAMLQREAEHDADIERYLAGMEQTASIKRANATVSSTQDYSAERILEHLQARPKDPCHWLRRWSRNANQVELDRIFTALLSSDEAEQVARLFNCFALTSMPRFDERLLKWALHPEARLQWAAVNALKWLTHPTLRATAVSLIDDGKLVHGIVLLLNNFQSGDFAMIAGYLGELVDEEEIHRVVLQILDLYEINPDADALDCLLYVYEHSPCSLCRAKAFAALVAQGMAPASIIAEAAFDVDPETRALASGNALQSAQPVELPLRGKLA